MMNILRFDVRVFSSFAAVVVASTLYLQVAAAEAGWLDFGMRVRDRVESRAKSVSKNFTELMGHVSDSIDGAVGGDPEKLRRAWEEIEKTPAKIIEDAIPILKRTREAHEGVRTAKGNIRRGLHSARRKIERFVNRAGATVVPDARAALAVGKTERKNYESATGILGSTSLPTPAAAGPSDDEVAKVNAYARDCWNHHVGRFSREYQQFKMMMERRRRTGTSMDCADENIGWAELENDSPTEMADTKEEALGNTAAQRDPWANQDGLNAPAEDVWAATEVEAWDTGATDGDGDNALSYEGVGAEDGRDVYSVALSDALGGEPGSAKGYHQALNDLEQTEAEQRRLETEKQRQARLTEQRQRETEMADTKEEALGNTAAQRDPWANQDGLNAPAEDVWAATEVEAWDTGATDGDGDNALSYEGVGAEDGRDVYSVALSDALGGEPGSAKGYHGALNGLEKAEAKQRRLEAEKQRQTRLAEERQREAERERYARMVEQRRREMAERQRLRERTDLGRRKIEQQPQMQAQRQAQERERQKSSAKAHRSVVEPPSTAAQREATHRDPVQVYAAVAYTYLTRHFPGHPPYDYPQAPIFAWAGNADEARKTALAVCGAFKSAHPCEVKISKSLCAAVSPGSGDSSTRGVLDIGFGETPEQAVKESSGSTMKGAVFYGGPGTMLSRTWDHLYSCAHFQPPKCNEILVRWAPHARGSAIGPKLEKEYKDCSRQPVYLPWVDPSLL